MTDTTKHVCPPDHRHGEVSTCYNHHRCRCAACVAARGRSQRGLRRAKVYGRYESPLVPALGAQRRVQALMRQGWSQAKLARHLGIPPQHVFRLLQLDRITRVRRDQVAALYDRLWDQVPDRSTQPQLIAYNRTIRYAKARRYALPLEWDDIDTDEAPALPQRHNDDVDETAIELALTGSDVNLTPAERRVAVQTLHGYGLTDPAIATKLGCHERTVLRIRFYELGLPAVDNPHTTTQRAA